MTAPVVNTVFVPGTTITHEWLNGVNDYVNESNPADHSSANVTYDPPFTNSVATTVEDKLAQYVSVKDFGAVGDGVTDDTVAIQNAINAGLTSNYKEIYFPQGIYVVSSKITIAPYYDPDIDPMYWSSVGKDYVLNFGTAIIKSTAATGSTVFEVIINNFPESRYNFTVNGGEFVSPNKPADWFKFVGGAYWFAIFDGCIVPSGQQATTFVRHYNPSLTAEPTMFTMKNLVVSADHVWLFDKSAGGLTYVDNFIFDNILHFGQDHYGSTIGLQQNCGIINAKISKIVQVDKGSIIGTGGNVFGGYLVYSTIKNCYSETKTSTYLINALLDKCTLESCNAAINDTSTQTVTWYYGQAYGCVFTSLHVTDVSLGGIRPYNQNGYHFYPVIVFLGSTTESQSNVIFGYNQNEYRNAINARQGKGAVSAVPGVCDIQVLTRYLPNLTSISTTGFVQTGKSVSAVRNLGENFTLDVYLDGKSITAGSKTLAVELRVGSDVIAIGPDISSTTGQWSANAKVQFFTTTTPGIYQVVSNFGQSWSGTTVSVNSVGTSEMAPVYVNATDSIILGLNVKSISGDIQIGTADMKVYSFGIYDTEA